MIVSRAFSRPVVLEYETQIREICVDVIENALKKSQIDATKDVARQIPMRVLGQILGANRNDFEWLVEKGDQLIANTDPEFTKHVLDQTDTEEYRLMPFRFSCGGLNCLTMRKNSWQKSSELADTDGVLNLVLQPGREWQSNQLA